MAREYKDLTDMEKEIYDVAKAVAIKAINNTAAVVRDAEAAQASILTETIKIKNLLLGKEE